ncbi:MAG: leucyl aminopeptidase [Deltaproteobacteria bacterium]|nr:leucyl aminopeptidase [Deltaproteobacteria bacterium]
MQLVCGRGSLTSQQTDLIAVSSFAPAKPEEGPPILKRGDGGVEVDKALGGMLTDTLRRGAFRAEPGAFRLIPTCGKLPARYVLLLGAGREKGFTLETLRQQGAAIQKAAQQVKAATAAGVLQPERVQRLSPRDRARALVEGLSLGSYRFDRYKAKEDRAEPSLAVMTLLVWRERAAVEGAMREGQWLADAAIYVRDLVNLPGNVCTPQYLAEQARQVARHGKLQCTILDQKQILAQRMHLLIAVSQGAPNPPVFCHLRYTPPKKPTTHIALVGKGVTFDTGGLDLKTAKHMEHMKNDMAGAATVLAAMRVAALAKPSCLIDAFLPCTENVIDGKAHRPGDIVTARSGTTVELLNLDAEGRLILADALDYALAQKPDYLIDVAGESAACGGPPNRRADVAVATRTGIQKRVHVGACAAA